jgi:hypothetical protein
MILFAKFLLEKMQFNYKTNHKSIKLGYKIRYLKRLFHVDLRFEEIIFLYYYHLSITNKDY